MIKLIATKCLKVPKIPLYNLQRSCLSCTHPARKLLNGVIKIVFTKEELKTCKATNYRKKGRKPLDQIKVSTVRGNMSFTFFFFSLLYISYQSA